MWDIAPFVGSNDRVPQGSVEGQPERSSDRDQVAQSPYPRSERNPPDRLQYR